MEERISLSRVEITAVIQLLLKLGVEYHTRANNYGGRLASW